MVGLGRLPKWATEKGVTFLSVTEGMTAHGGEVVNEAAEVLVALGARASSRAAVASDVVVDVLWERPASAGLLWHALGRPPL